MKVSRLIAILAVAGSVLAGSSAGGATRTAANPQRGGTLNAFASSQNFSSLDPIGLRGTPFYEYPTFAIYDALFYEEPGTLKIVPRIGQSLNTTDNGKTWTLKIRPNVKFSDGTAFDATAVQFNWQRIGDPTNKALALVTAGVIQSMDIVDPLTLRVTLKDPDPYWSHKAAYSLASIGSPTAIKAQGAAYAKQPVGAGPFVLKEWIDGVSMTLMRNPSYWEKGRPYLDSIVFKFIADDNSRYSTLRTTPGSIDYNAPPLSVPQIRSDGYDVVPMAPNGGGWATMFNTTKPPFNDVRVRQAINLTVDRAAFNKTRRGGEKSLMMTTVDEKYSPFYDPTIKVPATDLTAAQKLIDAYVADNGGKPVEFAFLTYSSSQTNLDDVTFLVAQISRLKNVTATVDAESTTAVIAKFTAGNYQAWHTTLGKWNEPAIDMPNVFLSTSPSNYAKWSNPTVDAALRQLTTETDQKTRVQLVHTVQQQILKDAPIVWYTRYASFLTEDKYVKNLNNYYDQRTLFDQVWVAKAKS